MRPLGATGPVLRTPRLLLRRWREDDLAPFAAINADPAVMRHLPRPLDREQSDAFVERIEAGFETLGLGLWATEVRATGSLIGFVGLARQTFEAPFNPSIEIGWRLTPSAWGLGHATEAAREVLRFAFEDLGLEEVVSMTVPRNEPSIAVMRRLGMTYDPADDHDLPAGPEGGPSRRVVLHRLGRGRWAGAAQPAVPPAPGTSPPA